MQTEPLIGVICDNSTSVLVGRLRAVGYRAVRVSPEQLIPEKLPVVDAWVIDCEDDSEAADAMAWIEKPVLALSNRPGLADLAEYRNWCDRIIASLDKWTASIRHGEEQVVRSSAEAYQRVQAIWVLSGSTGGVTAISKFFGAFTHMPPVAFVYAQHIHGDQQDMLKAVGHANSDLVCSMAIGRHWLNPGHLLIVPATNQLRFSKQGEVSSLREGWDSGETPNINQVLLAMSGMQPSPTGAIVFSGAGTDGCEGMRALKNLGTRVWAQEPSSAASPSMPSAAILQQLTDLVGTPAELAAEFMRLYPDTR